MFGLLIRVGNRELEMDGVRIRPAKNGFVIEVETRERSEDGPGMYEYQRYTYVAQDVSSAVRTVEALLNKASKRVDGGMFNNPLDLFSDEDAGMVEVQEKEVDDGEQRANSAKSSRKSK